MGQRDEFGDIGVDGHQFDADADAGNEAPEIDGEARGLERHDGSRDRVPDQGEGEHGAATVLVGHMAQADRTDEQASEQGEDECADTGHVIRAQGVEGAQ